VTVPWSVAVDCAQEGAAARHSSTVQSHENCRVFFAIESLLANTGMDRGEWAILCLHRESRRNRPALDKGWSFAGMVARHMPGDSNIERRPDAAAERATYVEALARERVRTARRIHFDESIGLE
jgi:hypothetical protein